MSAVLSYESAVPQLVEEAVVERDLGLCLPTELQDRALLEHRFVPMLRLGIIQVGITAPIH